jgi:hypothetical protein
MVAKAPAEPQPQEEKNENTESATDEQLNDSE